MDTDFSSLPLNCQLCWGWPPLVISMTTVLSGLGCIPTAEHHAAAVLIQCCRPAAELEMSAKSSA